MSIFELQTNGIYVHTDDATGLKGFQEVLGHHHHGKNKEHMAKLIASELRSLSFADFLSIPISYHHFMSLIMPLSKHMLQRWARIP